MFPFLQFLKFGKYIVYALVLNAIVLISVWASYKLFCEPAVKKASSYRELFNQATTQIKTYKDRNGKSTQVSTVAMVTKDVLKSTLDSHFNALRNEIKISKVKVLQTKETATNQTIHTYLKLKDSTIINAETLKVGTVQTPWFTLKQTVLNDSVNLRIQTRDTLRQIIYWRHKHKFWFIPYGPRVYESVIKNSSPYGSIVYDKNVIVEGK